MQSLLCHVLVTYASPIGVNANLFYSNFFSTGSQAGCQTGVQERPKAGSQGRVQECPKTRMQERAQASA